MKLIADSGSTKTDWRLVSRDGKIHAFTSEGINPYFHTAQSVADLLRAIDMGSYGPDDVGEVFFYAAGANTRLTVSLLEEGFQGVFKAARLHIRHDLLGAARSLFRTDSGIAAILGTGSNSCLFIDGEIRLNLGGHGYILGDEGSGMHLGRKVVRDFMNDLMPGDVREQFTQRYGLTKDEITYRIYKQPSPNRFLATFSKFVGDHAGHPYIDALIDDAFSKFVRRYIIRYENYRTHPLRIVGSIGHHFEQPIRARADHHGITIDKILRAPIDGLVEFHTTS